MTTLFRQLLEKSPKDLLPTVYLSSNSVAPAYQCVELGVGDAILIKAVGEASGTNAGECYELDSLTLGGSSLTTFFKLY
jgi:hypothetical protein